MHARDKQRKSRFSSARAVAEFWNITHLVSVGNPEDWKLAFDALIKATILLDKQNSSMVQLESEKLELIKLVEELNQRNSEYFSALEKLAEDFEVDISDYIDVEG